MNKEEVVRNVASKACTTQSTAEEVIKAFLDVVSDSMVSGNRVVLAGFGTFESKHRNARIGRNPHTGEAVHIPARTVPSFKPANALKDRFS